VLLRRNLLVYGLAASSFRSRDQAESCRPRARRTWRDSRRAPLAVKSKVPMNTILRPAITLFVIMTVLTGYLSIGTDSRSSCSLLRLTAAW